LIPDPGDLAHVSRHDLSSSAFRTAFQCNFTQPRPDAAWDPSNDVFGLMISAPPPTILAY
jgi:hypothetical protein